jgi:hypothetical protein
MRKIEKIFLLVIIYAILDIKVKAITFKPFSTKR